MTAEAHLRVDVNPPDMNGPAALCTCSHALLQLQRQQKADMDRIRAERDQLRSILAPVKQPRV